MMFLCLYSFYLLPIKDLPNKIGRNISYSSHPRDVSSLSSSCSNYMQKIMVQAVLYQVGSPEVVYSPFNYSF